MTGTTPQGVPDEQAASRWVRDMFGRVAGRYDLLNHLLSFNLDKSWRARTVERVAPILAGPALAFWICAAAPATCCWRSKPGADRRSWAAISAIPCWSRRSARSRARSLANPAV